ncbi:MAG: class Ib ribonucleoside-diphosphate reductase assembly flavoprotein NrdI [Lachnospiraceae bacterium]|nr:class Ib ribonucleoside-diphosphate reductase assembly flavoprotein NrdI [Lachnospiraceae bacterium]
MKFVYASRNGHVEGIVNRLDLQEAMKIKDGSEKIDGDFVLFTYTDGQGIIPKIVENFLAENKGIKAVVGSGNVERHPDTFNFAADKIAEQFNVPVLAKVNMDGTEAELKDIKAKIEAMQ